MSAPIVFISNQRIKEDQLDAYTQYYREVAEMTEASKPGMLAHLACLSEDGTKASVTHVFPDAESMELQMHGVSKIAKKASDFMEVASFDIYGKPSDAILDMMMQSAGSEVALNVKPQRIGGYIRLKSG